MTQQLHAPQRRANHHRAPAHHVRLSPPALGVPYLGYAPSGLRVTPTAVPGFGAQPYDPLRAAMMVRALHTEMTARLHRHATSPLTWLIAALEDDAALLGTWTRLAHTHDTATATLLAELDPHTAVADLTTTGWVAGIHMLTDSVPHRGLYPLVRGRRGTSARAHRTSAPGPLLSDTMRRFVTTQAAFAAHAHPSPSHRRRHSA